jgi:hypothetical protein
MHLGPNMFEQLDPPEIWVHVSPLVDMRDDSRQVTLRLKPRGGRSISASMSMSRYSPEGGIFRAVAAAIDSMEASHEEVTKALLMSSFMVAHRQWVDPF